MIKQTNKQTPKQKNQRLELYIYVCIQMGFIKLSSATVCEYLLLCDMVLCTLDNRCDLLAHGELFKPNLSRIYIQKLYGPHFKRAYSLNQEKNLKFS